MSQWDDFEKSQRRATAPRGVELLSCVHCGNTWLYKSQISQFSSQQVSVMQEPINIHGGAIPVLTCAVCGKMTKCNVASFQQTTDRKLYDQMLKDVLSDEASQRVAVILKEALGVLDTMPTVAAERVPVNEDSKPEKIPTE